MTTKTKTDIKTPVSAAVISTLNARLADTVDLHTQVKQLHWNVTGANFIALHELFDTQAGMFAAIADDLAERARALDAPAEGTARLAAERSTLADVPHGLIDGPAAVRALVERYQDLSGRLHEAALEAGEADDVGTEDLYVGAIRQVDEAAYFLRSHLQ
jgi:starvation-inducible DNA-binding protein